MLEGRVLLINHSAKVLKHKVIFGIFKVTGLTVQKKSDSAVALRFGDHFSRGFLSLHICHIYVGDNQTADRSKTLL